MTLSAQEKVYPKDGEGIYALLRRYNRTSQGDFDTFIQLNAKELGKNNTLLKGVAYTLPSETVKLKDSEEKTEKSSEKRKNPLFGSKYEKYEIKDNALKGACFFVVSGHGGPDVGCVGHVNGKELHEDEYAYDIMLRLARNLLEHGATVHIIIQDANDGIRDSEYLNNRKRETCMGEAIPKNQKKRLYQRVDKINRLSAKAKEKYKRAIFIHLDSQLDKQVDVYFFHSNSKASKRLAYTLKDTFEAKYKEHQPNRPYCGTAGYHPAFKPFVIYNTNPVSVFCELGNINHERDQQRFIIANNRQAMANWFLAALIKDYRHSGYRSK
ncbi:MAG: N-acetylmuramoyl-L-alanine amidase [Candidatus Symbiothrix sp.]|jgi:N-acetylmuramoyl-L-alanine amidase|nr:N-acetylmuramoyl-L-alanine amidase [Candidatus Symbiothrix sp.]